MVDLVEQAGDGAFVVPEGLDSVELKLTVPEGRGTEVAHALGVDPLDAQIRQIYRGKAPRGRSADWEFDEGAGTTATDSSANGNDASITNAVFTPR